MSEITENLEAWVLSKSKDELENIVLDCLRHMIMTEDVRVRDNGEPYWESCGVVLGEEE